MCSWIGRCWSSTDPASSGLDSGHNCRINPNECCWLFKRAGWLGEGGENKACSWKVDWDANRRAPGPVSAFSKQNGSLERHNGPCLQLGEGGCLFWGYARQKSCCWCGSLLLVCFGPIDTIRLVTLWVTKFVVQIWRSRMLLSFLFGLVFGFALSVCLDQQIYVAKGADIQSEPGWGLLPTKGPLSRLD